MLIDNTIDHYPITLKEFQDLQKRVKSLPDRNINKTIVSIIDRGRGKALFVTIRNNKLVNKVRI